MIMSWLVTCIAGHALVFTGAIAMESEVMEMLKEVNPYFAGIMAFYFANGIVNSVRSK